MIHTAYLRYDGELPCSVNGYTALDGFNQLGIKTTPFYGFGDVETLECGPEALVHGYIGDVHIALKKLGLTIPDPIDYPEELSDFYGRKLWKGTLGDVRRSVQKLFVKPTEQKLFTGVLWDSSRGVRLHMAVHGDDTPVLISEPVDFVSEYRSFILDGELLDVRRYKGDWAKTPSRDVVEAAVRAWKGPRAYTIDFGVTSKGETLIVECNDAYAMGAYGLPGLPYARMIEARWEQLTSV